MAGQLALYAAATGGSHLVGAALGSFREPPRTLTAGMLAFAAGALIVAVAFELFQPAHREAGLTRASIALLLGAATFIAVDLVLARKAGAQAVGLALVAAVTLDGVPENFASASPSSRVARSRSSPRSWRRTCRSRSAEPPRCGRAGCRGCASSRSGP
jgi:ZIP family zinc transporter